MGPGGCSPVNGEGGEKQEYKEAVAAASLLDWFWVAESWPGALSCGGQNWLQKLSDGGGEALGCFQV